MSAWATCAPIAAAEPTPPDSGGSAAAEAPAQGPGDFLVTVDAGHGRLDAGATSARGIPEFEYNRRLASELEAALERRGLRVTLLVDSDGRLSGREGVRERTRIANRSASDLFLSIHHDSVQERYLKERTVGGRTQRYSEGIRGYSLIYSRRNRAAARSREFASLLGDALLAAGFRPSHHHAEDIEGERRELVDPERGIYDVEFWVVKETRMPAVLLEAGLITDDDEELLLSTAAHRQRLVDAIVGAVLRFAAAEAEPGP